MTVSGPPQMQKSARNRSKVSSSIPPYFATSAPFRAVAVGPGHLRQLRRSSDGADVGVDSFPACEGEPLRRDGDHVKRRMRALNGLREHRDLRDPEVLTLVAEGVLGPGSGDDVQRLHEALLRLGIR